MFNSWAPPNFFNTRGRPDYGYNEHWDNTKESSTAHESTVTTDVPDRKNTYYENAVFSNESDYYEMLDVFKANVLREKQEDYLYALDIVRIMFSFFGLTGNVLSIIVLTRPQFEKNTFATTCTALAVSDAIVLLAHGSDSVLKLAFGITVGDDGYTCQMMLTVKSGSIGTSNWLLILITVERAFSVLYPLHVRKFTMKRVKITIVIIWLVMFFASLHYIIFGGVENGSCVPLTDAYEVFTYDIMPWLQFSVLYALPYLVIFSGSVIIICQMTRRNIQSSASSSTDRNAALTMTLLAVNLTYILTVSPMWVMYFLVSNQAFQDSLDLQQQYNVLFIYKLFAVTYTMNHVANFYLYCISGSKFREVLNETIANCCLVKLCKKRALVQQ